MKTTSVKNWYDWGGVDVDKIGTINFLQQAASSISFVETGQKAFNHHIVKSEPFTVSVGDGMTAACNTKTREIVLGINYANGNTYSQLQIEPHELSSYELLGMINGSMMHEGLHLALTPSIKQDFVNVLEKRWGKHLPLLRDVHNLVEDIYIEMRCKSQPETKAAVKGNRWIEYKNERLFSPKLLDHVLEQPDTLNRDIDLMSFFKNIPMSRRKKLRTALGNDLIKQLDETRRIAKLKRIENRWPIAEKILYILLERHENENDENDENDEQRNDEQRNDEQRNDEQRNDENENDENENDENENDENENDENDTDLNQQGDELDDSPDFGASDALKSLMQSFLQNALTKSDEPEKPQKITKPEYRRTKCENVLKISNKNRVTGKFDWNTPLDPKFVRELIYLNEQTYAPSLLRKRGNRINKPALHRIATTGKIFNDYTEQETRKRREIVILIDASGSTRGPIFDNEIRTARKMSDDMKKARIPHTVVAFSSGYDWGYGSELAIITSFDMKHRLTGSDDDRWAATRGLYMGSTPTADSLKHIRENIFTKRGGSKFIIVLSDGRPDDTSKTVYEINECRDQGIFVMSLSVVPDVMRYNDNIFSKEFNFNASGDALETLGIVLRRAMREAL